QFRVLVPLPNPWMPIGFSATRGGWDGHVGAFRMHSGCTRDGTPLSQTTGSASKSSELSTRNFSVKGKPNRGASSGCDRDFLALNPFDFPERRFPGFGHRHMHDKRLVSRNGTPLC